MRCFVGFSECSRLEGDPEAVNKPSLFQAEQKRFPAAGLLLLCFVTPGVLTMELPSPELLWLHGIPNSQPGAARRFQHSKDPEDTPQ